MRFYNRYFKSGYEELISYYPRFYRDVAEMVAILKAQGKLADGLEANIEQTYLNNFILYADEQTISAWETMLGIAYTSALTLDQRRRVVIGRISGYGHIGEPEIRALIANYTDKAVSVDFMRGILTIIIEGEVFDEANLYDTLLRRIPAHLKLNAWIHVRRTFRQQLDVCFGGAVGGIFSSSPVGEDRRSTTRVPLAYSGFSRSDTAASPVGEDRRATIPLHVAQGAVLAPTTACDPPEPHRAATGRTSGAGGLFYHTHIKSKLMG